MRDLPTKEQTKTIRVIFHIIRPYSFFYFMSKGTLIFFFGIALMLIPSLGIPLLWKQYILFGMGILLLLIGYIVRRSDYLQTLESTSGVRSEETFVETTVPLFSDTKVQ